MWWTLSSPPTFLLYIMVPAPRLFILQIFTFRVVLATSSSPWSKWWQLPSFTPLYRQLSSYYIQFYIHVWLLIINTYNNNNNILCCIVLLQSICVGEYSHLYYCSELALVLYEYVIITLVLQVMVSVRIWLTSWFMRLSIYTWRRDPDLPDYEPCLTHRTQLTRVPQIQET